MFASFTAKLTILLYLAFSLTIHYKPTAIRQKHFSIFALDDIVVRPGRCKHLHDYVYTFTSGYQDLELQYIQPIDRGIGELRTPKSDHKPAGAPPVDHTSNSPNGTYFLFMNTKRAAPTTYIDTLALVDLPEDDAFTCVRFAYQTVGKVTLKVLVAPDNADTDAYQMIWISN